MSGLVWAILRFKWSQIYLNRSKRLNPICFIQFSESITLRWQFVCAVKVFEKISLCCTNHVRRNKIDNQRENFYSTYLFSNLSCKCCIVVLCSFINSCWQTFLFKRFISTVLNIIKLQLNTNAKRMFECFIWLRLFQLENGCWIC